jgi:hypothetical protein
MSVYYSPDLTGVNPDYLVTNDIYVITSTNERIVFEEPIFANSIAATLIATGNIPLVRGIDWNYTTSDIAVTATAKVLTLNPSFDLVLIYAVEVIRTVTTPITISFQYQKLYPVIDKVSVFDNRRIDLTPSMILEMRNRLHALELQVRSADTTTSISNATPKLLQIDLSGTASANLITNEVYTVNTLIGVNVIFPLSGSFYATGLILKLNDGSGTILTLGTDYQIFGLNVGKTRATRSTSSVNDFVIVSKPYVGPIEVTYQAFGGEATVNDVTTIYGALQSITTYLETTPFVTVPSLATSPILLSLIDRQNALEDQLRVLINSGNPTYSDVSGTGTAYVLKVRSTDVNLHWWNIAQLFEVSGSSTIILADRMHIRIQMATSNVSADVFINVDLNIPNSLFTIDSTSVNLDPGYQINGTLESGSVVMPQFRVIYNTGGVSGIILQIGIPLPSLTESIGIEDLSGSQSCWRLLATSSSPVSPQDNTITLPDGESIWDTSNEDSESVIHMMPYDGYLYWAGALSVNSLTSTALTSLLPVFFNVSDISSIDLVFLITTSNVTYMVNVPINPSLIAGTYTGTAFAPNTSTGTSIVPYNVSISIIGGAVVISVLPESIITSPNLNLIYVLVNV